MKRSHVAIGLALIVSVAVAAPAIGGTASISMSNSALKKFVKKAVQQEVASQIGKTAGPAGPAGRKGDTGAPGTNGTNGTNGTDGAPGPSDGYFAFSASGNATVEISNLSPGGYVVSYSARAGDSDPIFSIGGECRVLINNDSNNVATGSVVPWSVGASSTSPFPFAATFGFFNSGPGSVSLDLNCHKTSGNGTFTAQQEELTAVKVGALH